MKNKTTDVFSAIGDPTRRQILFLLAAGAMNVHLIAGNFPVSRPAISKHVKVLEEAGLIKVQDKGRERSCTLHPAGFNEIKNWLDFYDKFWNNNLERLGKLLKHRSKPKNNKNKKS
jgi:DNA-binding transcriptional ArsR family regulator